MELLAGLHFFGQHADAAAAHLGGDGGLVGDIGRQNIHLDQIGVGQQALGVGVGHVVIQRNAVAGAMQAFAGFQHPLVGHHAFHHLDDDLVARQHGDDVVAAGCCACN